MAIDWKSLYSGAKLIAMREQQRLDAERRRGEAMEWVNRLGATAGQAPPVIDAAPATIRPGLDQFAKELLDRILAMLPVPQDEYVLILAATQGDAVAKAALADLLEEKGQNDRAERVRNTQ